MLSLTDSIKQTLAYYSIFNYPLTKEELFANLWQPPPISYEDYLKHLDNQFRLLNSENNLYLSSSNTNHTESRRSKLVISENKIKIALKAAKKIRSIPFLKAVFICNSVGLSNAEEQSDIDFFIITSQKRIWLVRFFCNLILRLFGLRVYGKKKKDKICLSFFVTENNLNLKSSTISESDIHYIYWLHQMIPIFDPHNLYKKFIYANNWTNKYVPYLDQYASSSYLNALSEGRIGIYVKRLLEKFWYGRYGDLIEKQAKSIQYHKLKLSVLQANNKNDYSVIIQDDMLKFHENDSRQNVLDQWKKIINNPEI